MKSNPLSSISPDSTPDRAYFTNEYGNMTLFFRRFFSCPTMNTDKGDSDSITDRQNTLIKWMSKNLDERSKSVVSELFRKSFDDRLTDEEREHLSMYAEKWGKTVEPKSKRDTIISKMDKLEFRAVVDDISIAMDKDSRYIIERDCDDSVESSDNASDMLRLYDMFLDSEWKRIAHMPYVEILGIALDSDAFSMKIKDIWIRRTSFKAISKLISKKEETVCIDIATINGHGYSAFSFPKTGITVYMGYRSEELQGA